MNSALFPIAGPLAGTLPWDSLVEDEQRYRRLLVAGFAVFAVLALVIPRVALEPITRDPVSSEEQPLTRIVLQPQPLPEVVQPPPQPAPVVKPEPKPRTKPVPPEPKQIKPPPQPETRPKPVDPVKRARDAAASAGLLAFKDDLMALRDSVDVNALSQTQTRRGEASAASIQRNLVAAKAASASAGINVEQPSTDTGGPALSGRETVAVQSTLAGSARPGSGAPGTSVAGTERTGGRNDDDIRRVMDSNKGAIFAIYNRALRNNPLLQGKLVFEMVIEPDGTVSGVTMLSSELEDDSLARKILSRVRVISFGAADVSSTRVNYSFDFLPHV